MPTVNIYEAKTQLSKLVDLASSGTDVVIARNGKPVARLTTVNDVKKPLVYGLLEGEGWIADDFNDPLPDDLQAAFEGRG
jgi:prevent-host-death family protein